MKNRRDRFGRYEANTELGSGAMSIVYKAWDPVIDRWVALKVIHSKFQERPDLQNEINRRILMEAKLAGRLNHPNIVTVFDAGIESNLCYIVMQYIKGQMLKDQMDTVKRYSIPDAISICLQICNAIDYAHRNEVIHRDIKPSNIMLDEENIVKVMDFGISSIGQDAAKGDVSFLGTPYYMAPEVVRHEMSDHRADLYALGVILYQLVTGKRPFEGESMKELFANICNEDVFPPSMFNSILKPDLEATILRSLSKIPQDRFDTARDFANSLESNLQKAADESRDEDLTQPVSISAKDLEKRQFFSASDIIQEVIAFINNRDMGAAARIISSCQEDISDQLIHTVAKNAEHMRILASVFVRANDFASAAKVYENMGAYNMAISLYKVSDNFSDAANLCLRIGEELDAARLFEMAGHFKDAADIYLRRERLDAAAKNFERIGDYLKAAECYNRVGLGKKSVQLLQKVPANDPRYFDSLLLTTEILEENKHDKLAWQNLTAAVAQVELDVKSIGAFYRLGLLNLKIGKYKAAQNIFNKIQDFLPDYQNVPQLLAEAEEKIRKGKDKSSSVEEEQPPSPASDKSAKSSTSIVSILPGVEFLKSSPLFSQLTLDEIKSLYHISKIMSLHAEEIVIPQGESGQGLFIVMKGEVAVEYIQEGTRSLITNLSAGSYVGEMSLIDDFPTSAQVRALTTCELMFIHKDKYNELLNADPQLRTKLMQVFIKGLAHRLRQSTVDLANRITSYSISPSSLENNSLE